MKTLPPQHMQMAYFSDMERQLLELFREVVFKPILGIMKLANPTVAPEVREITNQIEATKCPKCADVAFTAALGVCANCGHIVTIKAEDLKNASDAPLRAALRSGRVQYSGGVFSGVFNKGIAAAIQDIGGKFNRATGTYSIADADVPMWVRADAAIYGTAAKAAHDAVLSKLDQMQADLDAALEKAPLHPEKTVERVEGGFKPSAATLGIKTELGPEATARLAAAYSENVKRYVKTFSAEMMTDLRGITEENARQGYRFDKLTDGIKGRFDVTTSKARFLARQETALFMSAYRQERFGEAGVRRYMWSTSQDARVRPATGLTPAQKRHAGNHRRLDGQVFEYAKPPIVDTNTGRRANPGQDFNCRCVDVPVLDEA